MKSKTRLFGEHSQIYRQILCQAHIQLLELIKVVYTPNKSILVGYNTDSVFVQFPKTRAIDDTKYKAEMWKPKKYKAIEIDDSVITCLEVNEWKELDDIAFSNNDILINGVKDNEKGKKYLEKLNNTSFMCTGGGGT